MTRLITLLFCIISFYSYTQSNTNLVTPFLESVVSQFPNVRDIALSPNQNEAIISAQSRMGDVSALVITQQQNNVWNAPEILSFSGQYFDIEPFFSSDGLTLYFASNRPLNNSSNKSKDFDIWYVTRPSLNGTWSEPKNMGAPINSDMDEFYPILTNSGNFYFTLDNKTLKRKDDIYVSQYKNGVYQAPEPLGDNINSEGYEFNAFIASDESYIIYTCYGRKDGFGSGDLYISFKDENGQWSRAKNMGPEVNSDKMDYCPLVDTKTNTLYFTSKRNGTTTKFDQPLNIKELKKVFKTYENGASRLYNTKISEILNNR
ncbi:hypothetical protein [Psychroserpens sp. MEBiC05023]